MKFFFVIINLYAFNSKATDSLSEIYNLSNEAMEIVTHTKEFPNDGHFNLTTSEADLTLNVGKNDYLIGKHADAIANPVWNNLGCQENQNKNEDLGKKYGNRSFRVGAISINSLSDFEAAEKYNYSNNEYATFMASKGYPVTSSSQYNWENLIKRFTQYDPNKDAGTNSLKLAEFIKNETGLDVPKGTLASEFMYRDLLQKPEDWKKTLEKSKDALSFDEKIKLVAKLGNQFNNDYNYQRNESGSPDSKGIISTETLLRNLSTAASGGVCRDVSLSQSQMLKSLGVDESYSVAYQSNRGGHATLIVVDPNDKNRIIKLNYGDAQTDDGKKGKAALDQDNSLPNVGMRYRIYNNEGKPIASIPTELGSILKEVTDQANGPANMGSAYSLNKAYFSTDNVQGSIFNGKTSTGESITGVALHGKANFNDLVDVKAGVTGYKAQADKSYFDMKQTGLYGHGSVELRTTIYDGQYGKLGTGVGGSIEVLMVNTVNKSNKNNSEFKNNIQDVQYNLHTRSTYDIKLSEKDKLSASAQINTRLDKDNVADEGKRSFHYESSVLMSSYEHKFHDNLISTLEISSNLNNFGNNAAVQATLQQNSNKYTLGMTRTSSEAPSFLTGQNTFNIGYGKTFKNDWDLTLEYIKNLESEDQQFNIKAGKKF